MSRRAGRLDRVALLLLLVVGLAFAGFGLLTRDRARASARDGSGDAVQLRAPGDDARTPAAPLRYDLPAAIAGTDARIVMVRGGGEGRNGTVTIGSGGYSSSGDDGHVVNVVFLAKDGTTGRVVFDGPVLVSHVEYPGAHDARDSATRWITYSVVQTDGNRDGALNGDDDSELFVSALDGTNLRRVLPAGWNVEDYGPFGDGRSLIVTGTQGRSGDRGDDAPAPPQRAFLYDVPAGTLRPFTTLDSLVGQAARALSGRTAAPR